MYILELIYKLLAKKQKQKQDNDFEEDYKNCDHTFLPVDSTKKVLACIKCGEIKKIK